METWLEMRDRHARIEENFQEARYRDWQVLQDRFGDQIPPHELQAFEQHFGQGRHAQIIKERYEEAQRHPEGPQDPEPDRNRDGIPTASPQQERPTVHQRPVDLGQHYAEQKAYQAQSLAGADQLWNARLDRQVDAEQQQKEAKTQTLNSHLNPSVDKVNAAEQRREQERQSSPATKAEYEQFQKNQYEDNNPEHSTNQELHPKQTIEKAAEHRRSEEREQRMQEERERMKRQERERNHTKSRTK